MKGIQLIINDYSNSDDFFDLYIWMKEMYNNYEEEDDWDLPEEKDPFQEDLNQEVCIGTAQVFLQVHWFHLKMTL